MKVSAYSSFVLDSAYLQIGTNLYDTSFGCSLAVDQLALLGHD